MISAVSMPEPVHRLVRALVKLGYDEDVAERDLGRAIRSLCDRGPSLAEDVIIREVFASKRGRNR